MVGLKWVANSDGGAAATGLSGGQRFVTGRRPRRQGVEVAVPLPLAGL